MSLVSKKPDYEDERESSVALGAHLIQLWPYLWVVFYIQLLWIGGLVYTVGAAFYAADQYRYSHPIWHLFVLGGAACHCVAIGVYVIPTA